VKQACEDSLRRLGTDYVDLYQLHEPDPTVPIADTLGALDELVKAGKVREIGCSNFSVEQIRQAEAAVQRRAARFVSVQNRYSLLFREPEENGVLEECERRGLAFLPFFPLESGLLTGKVRRGQPVPAGSRLTEERYSGRFLDDRRVETVEDLIAWAGGSGHTVLELAFAWLLARRPVASVIAGATKPEQVRANVAAASAWRLSDDDLAEVDAVMLRTA
jgi:aryl-alcohol dehydrogenase-like predicted oxidoreductase